jgi:hypothetical protein
MANNPRDRDKQKMNQTGSSGERPMPDQGRQHSGDRDQGQRSSDKDQGQRSSGTTTPAGSSGTDKGMGGTKSSGNPQDGGQGSSGSKPGDRPLDKTLDKDKSGKTST